MAKWETRSDQSWAGTEEDGAAVTAAIWLAGATAVSWWLADLIRG
ncbi:MAG TPA: hypothetical protein VHK01_22595 [Lacipirellulaceae bacterium]|nr:hypothetical protein [Lacipirellulaceae bacterium]